MYIFFFRRLHQSDKSVLLPWLDVVPVAGLPFLILTINNRLFNSYYWKFNQEINKSNRSITDPEVLEIWFCRCLEKPKFLKISTNDIQAINLRTKIRRRSISKASWWIDWQLFINIGKSYLISTVKWRAVDRSTVQFWTILSKGHST